jgi:hypothetical protein
MFTGSIKTGVEVVDLKSLVLSNLAIKKSFRRIENDEGFSSVNQNLSANWGDRYTDYSDNYRDDYYVDIPGE